MSNFQHSSEEVILIPVTGSWISSQSVLKPPNASNENSVQIFENLKPKKCNSDTLCVVPVMPAVPPYVDEAVLKDSENHVEVSAPLKGRKSPYSDKSVRGYRSGRRSSLIPCRKVQSGEKLSPSDWVIGTDKLNDSKYVADFEHGTVYVRAKGCGMWIASEEIPFPAITLQKTESIYAQEGQELSEIRGVCFEHTSCTEMLVTGEIENNLNKIGLVCGNHPLGFWIYRNLKDDSSPLISKTVSMFETYGDRRLESHLFTGLERCISKKYDQEFAQRVIDAITPLYANINNVIPSNDNRTFKRISEIPAKPIHNKILDGSLFNFDDFDIEEYHDNNLQKYGLIPAHQIYEAIKGLGNDFVNLAKLYGRLGFEAGKCLSIIHRSGYLWGSYQDHNAQEFHCNAHPDNLVVLSKDQCLSNKKSLQILAPLDFDITYKKENSISLYESKEVPDTTK